MKKFILPGFLSMAMLLFLSTTLSAQKLKVFEGNFKELKGQTKINVIYTYDDMTVGKKTEDEYVSEKVAEKNAKESGEGDRWKEAWTADRANRFEPKFEELFNKYGEKDGVVVGEFPDAKYTLIVKTTHTEPGFNIGVVKKNAHINSEIWLTKTGNLDDVAAKCSINKVPGRAAYDFDVGYRIQESYAKCGKEFAKYLGKKVF